MYSTWEKQIHVIITGQLLKFIERRERNPENLENYGLIAC